MIGTAGGADAAQAHAQLAAFRVLHAVTKRIHASLDLTETLDAVARGVAEATGFAVAAISLRRPAGGYQVVAVVGDDDTRAQLLGTIETEEHWQHLLGHARRWGDLRFIDHSDESEIAVTYTWVPDLEISEDPLAWHPMDSLFAPLQSSSGEWLGALAVDVPADGRRPQPHQLEVLSLFADHAAIAIEHAGLHSALQANRIELEHAATHDPLTGLANRTLLHAAGSELSARESGRLAVAVLDLNGFKAINDTGGHRAGDAVLAAIASRMRDCLGPDELLARVGGDEFVILSVGPDAEPNMWAVAQRVRRAIDDPVRTEFGSFRVGISIGVAAADVPADFTTVLAAADAHMYADKRSVRPPSVA